MASVGHQPPVSCLPTVHAHLVLEEEAHLRRIFDVQKSQGVRGFQRHFWDYFEKEGFKILDLCWILWILWVVDSVNVKFNIID